MPEVRPAATDDVDLLARIAAEGFYGDPVMSWALRDDDRRLGQLLLMFRGLAEDFLPPRGHAFVADGASVCFWRDPGFAHHGDDRGDEEGDAAGDGGGASPFDAEELDRFAVLRTAMHEAHPSDPHWYLSLVSTLPSDRSRGLGAAVLAPIIARADAEAVPCYLESTNPRNRTLYYRHGFEDLGDIHVDDGVSMRQMWRLPVTR
jgi:GNAT superfamily N-acetyltransferase